MKLTAAFVILALAGCGGSSNNSSDGGGGGGGAPTPCTLTVSGPVTAGTYQHCRIIAGPQGGNQIEVAGTSLPDCNDCMAIWTFSQTPTDTCSVSNNLVSVQVVDPTLFPDAISMALTNANSQATCTITTSQIDLAGGHWSGKVDGGLFATDFNFNVVGVGHVTITGAF